MCSTGRHSHPTSTSTELLVSEHTNPATGSSSEVNDIASDSHQEVSESPFERQNSNNHLSSSLRESRTPSPGLFSESDDDVHEIDDLSDSTAPMSAVSNTSLLKSLDIGDNDEPTDANSVSNLLEDKNHNVIDETLTTGDEAELSSESNIDFSNITVHELFQYLCSRNSSRIYVYDKVSVSFQLLLYLVLSLLVV